MASKVQGLDKLQKKLKKLPEKVEADAKKAIGVGAQELVNLMQSLAPVGKTGKLRDSIEWNWGDAPKYAALRSSKQDRTGGGPRAIVSAGNTNVRYAHLVEFGTAPHEVGGIFEGAMHPGTTAQPFFFPAYRALRRRVRGRITRAINKATKEVAKGGK